MLLYYHKDPRRNFGDDLNPWLWHRLLPGAFHGELAHESKGRPPVARNEQIFVGIGTLLNRNIPENARKIVFGAGAGYGAPPIVDSSWDICCVRGPVTAKLLGLASSFAVTDAAVLIRTVNLAASAPVRGISYMPHCSSARNADWSEICADAGLNFIDPQAPVDDVLSSIRSSEMLITEAMHGAIVADALRIPWLPVYSASTTLHIKWQDWCQSLGLPYQPARVPSLWTRAAANHSALARARSRFKQIAAKVILRRLVRNGKPLLSAETRLEQATAELQERLAKFRQRYCA